MKDWNAKGLACNPPVPATSLHPLFGPRNAPTAFNHTPVIEPIPIHTPIIEHNISIPEPWPLRNSVPDFLKGFETNQIFNTTYSY